MFINTVSSPKLTAKAVIYFKIFKSVYSPGYLLRIHCQSPFHSSKGPTKSNSMPQRFGSGYSPGKIGLVFHTCAIEKQQKIR